MRHIDVPAHIPNLSRYTDNFLTWYIDMKALLRRHDLWDCVANEVGSPEWEEHDSEEWETNVVEAADFMTLFIAEEFKRKLKPEDFDNGYELMIKLEEIHDVSFDGKGNFLAS
ncbi:uncharacterized protein RCC_05139 [Ramularia collo-cygni]|uniref:DUF4219 domain-containing protein n=1 Tax=Ramularia collo-cygni TaxID=112498 RepID=A0A2D3VF64_9PEZI|nr:uncharacterized protein RCC_05139 [Ramularia collo-cygni]CZT19293.1 uncharacterized protein RCC_05139 [Ramularia collo-cygni]